MHRDDIQPLNVFCANPHNSKAKYPRHHNLFLQQNRRFSFPETSSSEDSASIPRRMDARDFWKFRERRDVPHERVPHERIPHERSAGLRRTNSARRLHGPPSEQLPISRLPRGIKGGKLRRVSSDAALRVAQRHSPVLRRKAHKGVVSRGNQKKNDLTQYKRKRPSVYEEIPADHVPEPDTSTLRSNTSSTDTNNLQVPSSIDSGCPSSEHSMAEEPVISAKASKLPRNGSHQTLESDRSNKLPRNASNQTLERDPKHKLPRNGSDQNIGRDPSPRSLPRNESRQHLGSNNSSSDHVHRNARKHDQDASQNRTGRKHSKDQGLGKGVPRSRSADDILKSASDTKPAPPTNADPPPLPKPRDGKPLNEDKKPNDDQNPKTPQDPKLLKRALSRDVEAEEAEIKSQKFPFDVAKVIPKERISESESFEGFVKFLRLSMYILIFVSLLAAVSLSMSSFLLLEAAVLKSEDYRWNAQSQLLWIICVPQVFIFVISCFRTIFGDYEWPTYRVWLAQIVVEILYAIGVATLVFRVLPHFGSFYALGLIHAISILPAFLKIVFGKSSSPPSFFNKEKLFTIADILAFLVQVAAIGIPLMMFNGEDHMQKSRSSVNWQLPLALILVSLKWWENFVGTNRLCLNLNDLKTSFHNTRITSNTVLSTVNIAVTIMAMYAFESMYGKPSSFDNYFHPPITESQTDHSEVQFITNGTLLSPSSQPEVTEVEKCHGGHCAPDTIEAHALGVVCICSSLAAYFLASLACKLMMQRISFALPLVACAPVVTALMYMQCQGVIPKIHAGVFVYEAACSDLKSEFFWCALWWISLVWISRHIWSPEIDRLAFNDRIFVAKLFCGPFVAQSLMMNRRNDHQDEKLEWFDADVNTESEKKTYDDMKLDWKTRKERRIVPKIYACGTMWHETRNEMIQILKSIMRMDIDQKSRMTAENFFEIIDPDYYEFETHIFFDDCMDLDEDDSWIPNKFVVQFIHCVDEAASSVHKEARELDPPLKTITPYGGSLTWTLPCGNKMIVHLKDKHKIRHRKRWSQVMYMYHLLGYRLFEEPDEEIVEKLRPKGTSDSSENNSKDAEQTKDHPQNQTLDKTKTGFGQSETFQMMSDRKMVEAENTFLLALDGDVDFKPDAVRLLVDRMKVNPRTGAVCGRIHPIGNGPLVWYQKFEYAVGHWFQKATEHVLGSVLCSPGCFSLFRGSALLDDNVMKRYTAEPTEAAHYVQYDQGEDRWLCTLLLQQGYFVDYCAASDALTYAPENFDEFFNQRRRWTPSTIANIIDLLSDAKNTVNINANISYLYIIYQFLLMVSMVLGPSTIILAIATAFKSVFAMSLWQSYLLSIGPVIFYLVICFKCKTKTQLLVAQLLSTIYACVMTVVLVGVIQTIVTSDYLNPTLLFLAFITASFIFAGVIHPYEFFCLIHGILYYLCIPAGYLILMIYSMSNLHVVSWGTREVKKRKSKAQMEREKLLEEQKQAEKLKKKGGILAYLRLDVFLKEFKDTLTQALGRTGGESSEKKQEKYMRRMLREMRKIRMGDHYSSDSESDSDESSNSKSSDKASTTATPEVPVPPVPIPEEEEEIEIPPDDVQNPAFIMHPSLGKGDVVRLNKKEEAFFHHLIVKYLKPIKKDKKKEEALKEELIELRDHSSFGFWFMNLLWILFNYMMNRDDDLNKTYVFGYETQPLGFVFIIFFVMVLTLQIIGMVMHRWETFLQLISITELRQPLQESQKTYDKLSNSEAIKIAREAYKKNSFDELLETSSSSASLGDRKQRTRNVIRNVQRLASQEPHRARGRDRRYRPRRPRHDDVAISMGDDVIDEQQPRERIDRRLDRIHERQRHEARGGIHYRETMQRHFQERFGHLSPESRAGDGGGVRHRFGGGDDRSNRKNSQAPSSDRHRYYGDRGREDPNERAMRRLRRLAAN